MSTKFGEVYVYTSLYTPVGKEQLCKVCDITHDDNQRVRGIELKISD